MQQYDLYYTDGCHPALHVSSRMVIHHYRFAELLPHRSGILNEFPRKHGGCTFRFPRFSGSAGFEVAACSSVLTYVPWWLPATENTFTCFLARCYEEALHTEDVMTKRERETLTIWYRRLRDMAAIMPEATLGEVVYQCNEQAYQRLFPTLPTIALQSFTKDPLRFVFAAPFRTDLTSPVLTNVLSAWATHCQVEGFHMLAVGSTPQQECFQISWSQKQQRLIWACFDPVTGARRSPQQICQSEWIADSLESGHLILGGRLLALVEMTLANQGYRIAHFGNTYGKLEQARAILYRECASGFSQPTPQEIQIALCNDDDDSWNLGVIDRPPHTLHAGYPLHLLDFLANEDRIDQTMLHTYVQLSLEKHAPLVFVPGKDLHETLSHRRA